MILYGTIATFFVLSRCIYGGVEVFISSCLLRQSARCYYIYVVLQREISKQF